MKIVVDDKIPYIRPTLEKISDDVVYLRGSEISKHDLEDADALLVRTRTRCDEQLLSGTKVQFVATATIGYDHLDTDYLTRQGIEWVSCPGCNAGSVNQYLHSVLLLLEQERGIVPQQSTVGVVGHGHVGSRVARTARQLGYRVIVCDPFLEGDFCTLEDIAREADIITFHVPLHDGEHSTWHMGNKDFFDSLRRVPYIINTSRGPVVSSSDLLNAINEGKVRDAIIDVWENEPDISRELLDRVYIGTPHIAGYSADGKVNANNIVISKLCQHFGLDTPTPIQPPPLPADHPRDPLSLYNPHIDSRKLKSAPEDFEKLRGDYPLRREDSHPDPKNG